MTEVVCDWCGEPFDKAPSAIGKHNFCSRECFNRFREEQGKDFCGLRGWSKPRYNIWRMAHGLDPVDSVPDHLRG